MTDVAAEDLVLRRDALDLPEQPEFGVAGGQLQRALQPDRRRHGAIDQLVEVPHAQRGEHLLDVARVRPEMAIDESVRMAGGLHGGRNLTRFC